MKSTYSDVSETKIQKEIQLFNNPEFGDIRTSVTESNEPLFCLADVCKILGLENTTRVKSRLDKDGLVMIDLNQVHESAGVINSMLGNSMATFVNESNFYDCIFESVKPEAKRFRKWVTSEVLPTIRKTGGYMVSKEDDTPEVLMARALFIAKDTMDRQLKELEAERKMRNDVEKQKAQIEQQKNIVEGKNEILKKENEYLAPKAQYTDEVLQSASTFTTSQIAQSLGMSAILLNKKLNLAGIQYKQSGQWMLYAKHRDHGYANIRVSTYVNRRTDEIESTQSLVWTEKGRLFIHDLKKGGKI